MKNLSGHLSGLSPLTFPITLTDGTTIETVVDASRYFAGLSREQRAKHHWHVAIKMLEYALREASYLKAATMSLQTAFLLEGMLESPHPLDAHEIP